MTSNVASTRVFAGSVAPEGSCVVPLYYNWAIAGASPNITTLNNLQNSTKLTGVQCLFVDNSLNDAPVSIEIVETQQKITLAAGYQGYFPVMVTSRASFTVSSTSTLRSSIIGFMNYRESYGIWPAYGTPASSSTPIPVTDVVLDACVVNSRLNVRSINAATIDVARYVAIAVGGTAVLAAAADANRRGWLLQNIDVTLSGEALLYSLTNTTALPNTPGTYELAAYSAAGYPGGSAQGTGTGAIYVNAATAGHLYSLTTW